jgi:hypothetical protein
MTHYRLIAVLVDSGWVERTTLGPAATSQSLRLSNEPLCKGGTQMKRSAALLTIVLTSLIVLYAQESKVTEMTGWVCNSACVKQSAGQATCDATCQDKSGDAVFVEDSGKVTKIANPDMVKGKMGQKVKVKCTMDKDKEAMQILQIVLANAG